MMRYRRFFLALIAAVAIAIASHSSIAHAQNSSAPFPLDQSLNLAWVLVAGFLVMFMQVGFAMLETGFTRSKNAVNTMAMNFIIYPLGVIGFFISGYGLMMGGVAHWTSLGAVGLGHHELSINIGGH